jgi:hypothetical protein
VSARRTIPDGVYRWADDPTISQVVINGRISHALCDNRDSFDLGRLAERFKALAEHYQQMADEVAALNRRARS